MMKARVRSSWFARASIIPIYCCRLWSVMPSWEFSMSSTAERSQPVFVNRELTPRTQNIRCIKQQQLAILQADFSFQQLNTMNEWSKQLLNKHKFALWRVSFAIMDEMTICSLEFQQSELNGKIYTVSQKMTLMLHTITSMHINQYW